jgi:hypothetical protein
MNMETQDSEYPAAKKIHSKNQNKTKTHKNHVGIKIPNVKLYYRTIEIKIAWSWHKSRYMHERNRIGVPEISPIWYCHLILDKCVYSKYTH